VLRKKYSNVRWNITSRSRKLNSIDEVGHASHTRRALPNTNYRTSGQRMCLMKCQRILTKGRIALATVTLAAGESILKRRFCGNALPLRISPQPRAATGVCCLHSLLHFNGGNNPTNCPFSKRRYGPPPITWFLGPTRVQNPNGISIGSAVSVGLTVESNRPTDTQTDHATSVATGRIFALCACDAT